MIKNTVIVILIIIIILISSLCYRNLIIIRCYEGIKASQLEGSHLHKLGLEWKKNHPDN